MLRFVTRVTVFGAGAMGTAMAMHLARAGHPTLLWASGFDTRVLPALREQRRHPSLPEHLPDSLRVLGPEDLAAGVAEAEVAVLGAHSAGARTLVRMIVGDGGALPTLVGVAKGLEPGTRKRMSQVYAEEVGHHRVVSVAGPSLASEFSQDLPTGAVFASVDIDVAERAAAVFRTRNYRVVATDDLAGAEYCAVAKNVAAIGVGILDGLGKGVGLQYRNGKAALFSQAIAEMVDLVTALGGRAETAGGLAGLGDVLVTSLGGRNRLYGELVGEGAPPRRALEDLVGRGMTVEGVDSARDVHLLAAERRLHLPYHEQIYRILFEDVSPATLLELPERMKS